MKNILGYYYNIYPMEISHTNDKYFFEYNDDKYIFETYKRPLEDINALYDVNKKMLNKNILVSEMILNNESEILTNINNKPYLLTKVKMNIDSNINLYDIYNINVNTISLECNKILDRNDWTNLWESKNDYFEFQINEIGSKYKIVSEYLNYYIGLAENAISYVKDAIKINDDVRLCISHKRIRYNDTVYSLYNPVNYIYDYFVRDICEYIKSVFFIDKKRAYYLVVNLFNNFSLTYKEALLFYGRLLYPSYFFDMYDDIVNGLKEESKIEGIITKSCEYEIFLQDVYIYISKLYNDYIPSVDWIIKRSFN